MLKKINHYLLVNYPLLWNTKVFIVLGVSILAHIAFYIIGYASFFNIRQIYMEEEMYAFFAKFQVTMYITLVIVLAIIIWLIFYLRNNAFKNFYPITVNYLRKEFLIVWFILFSLSTTYFSYAYGKHQITLHLTKHLNPLEDIKIVNQAKCFLPFDIESFESYNSCDSIQWRDSINSLIVHEPNDSCNDYSPKYQTESEYEEAVATEMASEVPANSYEQNMRKVRYSYLNFCSIQYHFYLDSNNTEVYSENAKKWLKNKDKAAIKQCLTAYFNIMAKYETNYNANIDTLVNWCFEDDLHTVNNTINNSSYYNEYGSNSSYLPSNTIESSFLENAIESIVKERNKSFIDLFEWELFFYFSLSLSFLLMMFRLTRLKPWLISIVGQGIWGIIFAIIGQFLDGNSMYVFLSLSIFAIVFASYLIHKKKRKMMAAIWLNWFVFSMLAIFPLIIVIIKENTYEIKECINQIYVITRPRHPINKWISNNQDTIQILNIVGGFLLFLYVAIPLCFKWQANPNE
jgi:hypothetical protein